MIIPTHLLCQMQASSSGAELLSAVFKFSLLAEVSHDEAKMRERREVSLLSLIFSHYTKKRDARAKLLFCLVKPLLFLLSRRRFIIYLRYIVIRQKQNFLSAN